MKCKTCEVMKRIKDSNEPACCIWYMDNVVCGDKTVDDCNEYEPPKGGIERLIEEVGHE